ncbi:MAG: hypothetical protein O2782_10260 [bacterium]|nr:hypothetical protein [bacterium]
MAWPVTTRGEDDTPVVVDVADEMPAARVQSPTWHGFLSWQLTPEHSSRFILDMDLEQDICRVSGCLENHAIEGAYEAGLLLALRPQESLHFSSDEEPTTVAPRTMIERRFSAAGAAFVWRGRTFEVPAGATLSYPLIPHNPYTQHGLPAEDDYVGRLSWLLTARTTTVTIR